MINFDRAASNFTKPLKGVHFRKLFMMLKTKFVRKDEYKWMFGSLYGTQIGDNPYALLRQILALKEESKDPFWKKLDLVWSCNTIPEDKIEGVRYVNRNSKDALKEALTARVLVFDHGEIDIINDNLYLSESYKVQLWHGTAWKKLGADDNFYKEKSKIRKILHHVLYPEREGKCLYIAPSDRQSKIIQSAFIVPESIVLEVGQPRNEMFFDKDRVHQCRVNILSRLDSEFGVKTSQDIKIIAYMPTFRDSVDDVFSFLTEDLGSDFYHYLEANHIIIAEKNHFATIVNNKVVDSGCPNSPNIVKITNVDTQEFLAAADMLITDYSSCFFDFLLLDRPIIHYLYDYDFMKEDRGLYFTVEEVAAGDVAYDLPRLLSAIRENMENPDLKEDLRKKRRGEFVTYESPDNSKKILKRIIHDVYGK